MLSTLVAERRLTMLALRANFKRHPDAPIYQSLPQVGDLLAPALLSKLGDDRGRFPTPAVLQAVAGTCPITKRSGQHKRVQFWRACDHAFRQIVQQWAKATLKTHPIAQSYYRQVRPHCHSDEATHLRQRALRAKPRSAA